MTRQNTLTCIHEPFGDAFYFGPERLGSRYANDEKSRAESGFADSTYKTILDRIDGETEEVCAFQFSSLVRNIETSKQPTMVTFFDGLLEDFGRCEYCDRGGIFSGRRPQRPARAPSGTLNVGRLNIVLLRIACCVRCSCKNLEKFLLPIKS